MIIEKREDLFFGSTAGLKDIVDHLYSLLLENNDSHTVISCLAVMCAMTKVDQDFISSMTKDLKGLDDMLKESIAEGLRKSDVYLAATQGELK